VEVIEARLDSPALQTIMHASIASAKDAEAGSTTASSEAGPGECELVILGTSGVDDRAACAIASALSNLPGCRAEVVLMSARSDASLQAEAPAVDDAAADDAAAEAAPGDYPGDDWDEGNSFDACTRPWDTSVGDLILSAFREVLVKPVTKRDIDGLVEAWIAPRCGGGNCSGQEVEVARTPQGTPQAEHGSFGDLFGCLVDTSRHDSGRVSSRGWSESSRDSALASTSEGPESSAAGASDHTPSLV
jgi:hypothetical protein